jgi:DNA-binding NarL/FixJ family response regulator
MRLEPLTREAPMVRLLLADDHDVVRRGLRDLLEERDGWVVCAEARDGRGAVALALEHRPDVVVLDILMPGLNGVEAARQIRRALPSTEVLIFSMHESEQLVRDAIAAGARGYVVKADAPAQVVAAVAALADHKPFFTPSVSEALLDSYLQTANAADRTADVKGLSSREREIVQLLAEGRSNKEIASTLFISVRTVETHRAAIMRKLEIGSIVELVRYAVRNKLIEP